MEVIARRDLSEGQTFPECFVLCSVKLFIDGKKDNKYTEVVITNKKAGLCGRQSGDLWAKMFIDGE